MTNKKIKYIDQKRKFFVLTKNYSPILGVKNYRQSVSFNKLQFQNIGTTNIKITSIKLNLNIKNKVIQSNLVPVEHFKINNIENISKYPFILTAKKILNLNLLFYELYSPMLIKNAEIIICYDDNEYRKSIDIINYHQKNKFQAPIKGKWIIVGNHFEIWAHQIYDNCKMGLDFIIVDDKLKNYKNNMHLLKEHYCFGKTIYAPAHGKIVEFADGLPDNPTPYNFDYVKKIYNNYSNKYSNRHLGGGNYIVIDHGQNEFSYLGHLKKDSINVIIHQLVNCGDAIAKCGNSGTSSISPHLHYQLMDKAEWNSTSLPIEFSNVCSTIFKKKMFEKMGSSFKDLGIFLEDVSVELIETS